MFPSKALAPVLVLLAITLSADGKRVHHGVKTKYNPFPRINALRPVSFKRLFITNLDGLPRVLFSSEFPWKALGFFGGNRRIPAKIYLRKSNRFFVQFVPGLNGQRGTISIRLPEFGNAFLIVDGKMGIRAVRPYNDPVFVNAATFRVTTALDGCQGISIESVLYPLFFIRASRKRSRIMVSRFSYSTVFAKESSWDPRIVGKLVPDILPTHGLRIKMGVARLNNRRKKFIMNWIVRPALSGHPGAVSFQIMKNPNAYLRIRGYKVVLAKDIGDYQEAIDSSWVIRPARNGGPGFSFESVRYPGLFLSTVGRSYVGVSKPIYPDAISWTLNFN